MSNLIKKMAFAIFLLLIATPAILHAKELKNGMPLLSARQMLIKAGWQPVNLHIGDDNEYFGATKELMDAHIMEVEQCAMDKALCIFNYKKRHQCLRLFTRGEAIKDMRVYHWTHECLNRN